MRSRPGVLATAALLVLSAAALRGADYHIVKQTVLGGQGGFDYITIDPDSHRVYIPRATHVMVIDERTHASVADISGMKGLHGTAIVPAVNRGFVSGNEGDKAIVYVFDLKTNALTGKIETGEEDADGILYDAATKRVYVNNGEPMSTTVIDPATLKVVGSIKDGGEPEAAATDGNGRLFINLVDKASVAVVDARAMKVTATWSAAPCERGYGAAFDAQHHRLFLACQGAKPVAVVMNADTGKVVATMPIGAGSDGAVFDPSTGDLFFACRDSGDATSGVVNVFHEDSPDRYTKVADVKYMYGAKTIALDPSTHHVFSMAATKNDPVPPTPQNKNPRPRADPATFSIVEVGK